MAFNSLLTRHFQSDGGYAHRMTYGGRRSGNVGACYSSKLMLGSEGARLPCPASFQGCQWAMGTEAIPASMKPFLPPSHLIQASLKKHFVKALGSFQHSSLWPSWAAGGGLSWYAWH